MFSFDFPLTSRCILYLISSNDVWKAKGKQRKFSISGEIHFKMLYLIQMSVKDKRVKIIISKNYCSDRIIKKSSLPQTTKSQPETCNDIAYHRTTNATFSIYKYKFSVI